jgi:flagellar hook assembly protein FlgD
MKFQDKAGRLVHEIYIQNGVPYEWDGSGNRGEEIPGGYYYVTIEFSDGSFTYGYLTINR